MARKRLRIKGYRPSICSGVRSPQSGVGVTLNPTPGALAPFDVAGWDRPPKGQRKHKPSGFFKFTNDVIYCRYREVTRVIDHARNPVPYTQVQSNQAKALFKNLRGYTNIMADVTSQDRQHIYVCLTIWCLFNHVMLNPNWNRRRKRLRFSLFLFEFIHKAARLSLYLYRQRDWSSVPH